MGYDFMVGNAIGALPHRATLVREDNECLKWVSTDYKCGSSQWNAEEEDRIVQAVQAVGAKSRGDRGVQLTEYGMAPQVYARMIQTLGAEAPETDVFASRDAPLLRKCRRHWHRGDSAWLRHWGLKEWGPMYWHGSLENTRRTVEKIVADRAKGDPGHNRYMIHPMSAGRSQVDAGFHHPERDVIRARGGVVHRRQGFINAPPWVKRGVPRLSWWMGRKPSPRVMKHSSVGLKRCPCRSCLSPRRGRISQWMALTCCPTPRSTTSSTTRGWGCTTMWQPRRGGPWSHLRIGGMTRCWSPASTRRMSSWRGSWITSRTNIMVRLGWTRRRGIFQEWGPVVTRTQLMPQVPKVIRGKRAPRR